MKRLTLSLTLISLIVCCGRIIHAQDQRSDRLRVDQGAKARLELQTAISSKLSEVGDPVRAVLHEDLLVDGYTVLAQGTEFLGRVTHVKAAGRPLKQAELAMTFDRVKTSYGYEPTSIVITAIDDYANDRKLKGDGEGVVRGGHETGRLLRNIGLGGGLGSLGASSIILMGGRHGGWTAGGIAIAGGMGAGVLLSKGGEIRLGPGTILRIQFERAMTLPGVRPPEDQNVDEPVPDPAQERDHTPDR